MNFSMIRYTISGVIMCIGTVMILPAIVGACYGEKQGFVYLIVGVVAILLGTLGIIKKPKSKTFFAKEGFVSVSLSWVVISLLGAIPFVITGEIPSYIDACFETISGFTTTGSSILNNVEALSHASLFWRSFTHWIGGMGVLVFIMMIMPLTGSSSMHMMRAESPGPTTGKLVPKVKSTATILYMIYGGITIAEIIALLIAGLDPFEASTLTFGTVGTGGFALLSTSIGSYSLAVQIIITIFMIICSINFSIYFLILVRKPKLALLSEELRWYLIMVFGAALLITINVADKFENLYLAFHHSLFQVASMTSTTGYTTTDFGVWPMFSQTILLFLMFAGACAGSTGGGFKMSRILILVRAVKNEIKTIIHPRSYNRVKVDGKVVNNDTIRRVLCYLGAYVVIAIVSILIVSLDGFTMKANISAVMATFNNIGPGLAEVGPTHSFSDYSIASKLVLMFDMLAGRIEIFPMIILFTSGFWSVASKVRRK